MSATGIKQINADFGIFYGNVTCLSDINVSGLSVFNNLNVGGTTTFNLPLTNNNSVVSLNYDNSLNLVGNNLSVVKTASNPISISGNNFLLNYDNSLNLVGNSLSVSSATASKWTISSNNIFNNNIGNVGIGTDTPQNKLEVLNGSINTTDYKFNNTSLFEYAPANEPTFFGGSRIYINSTTFCIQFLNDGTLTIPANMTFDVLLVGAGGRGGAGAFGGGGGGGEVVYIQNYTIPAGIYSIQCGIDSATFTDRQSRIYIGTTDLIKANGGGNGGNGAVSTLSPFIPKAWTSSTSEVARTINSISCSGRNVTINTTGLSYGDGTYELYYSSLRYALGNANNPHASFNFDFSNAAGAWRAGNYATTTGTITTQGNGYYMPDINYKGDWFCVKFPSAQIITQFKIYRRSDVPERGAKAYRIYASNNSTTWVQLLNVATATYDASNIHTSSITNSTAYLYYCFCVNSLIGGTNSDGVNLNEIVFLGNQNITSATTASIGGSGGGGGGGALMNNQTGASAGTPFNATYSKLTAGASGTNTQGGNGGSALATGAFNNNISGVFVDYGLGGTGATATSTPQNPPLTSKFGTGGDGNGGLGRKGALYFRYSASYITKFLEYTNWNKLFNVNVGDGLKLSEANNNLISSYWTLNTNNYLYNNNTGVRIGIGTTTPTAELDVNGLVKCNYFTAIDNNSGGVYCQVNNFNTTSNAISQLGILNSGLGGTITYYPSTSTSPNLFLLENTTGDLQLKTLASTSSIYINNTTGNIGIGVNNPTFKLQVNGSLNATSLNLSGGNIISVGNISSGTGTFTASTFSGRLINGSNAEATTLTLNGSLSGATTITASSTVSAPTFIGTLSGNASTATTATTAGSTNNWYPANNFWYNSLDGRSRFHFVSNGALSHTIVRSGSSQVQFRNDLDEDICYIDRYGVSAYFEVVTVTTDNITCVEPNTNGTFSFREMLIKFGSFTEFHRCYIEDELYNGNYENFVNEYVGRVVISKGKIKQARKEKGQEWEILENKEGITIDDAQPIIELSRKKKDKRIYGIITNRTESSQPDRICVNGLGEGGIWVINTNGNLENGDLIQTSDELGYAERQDDDFIRNYTIGKVVMDCDFNINSLYYKCEIINNERNIRRAFLACIYMTS